MQRRGVLVAGVVLAVAGCSRGAVTPNPPTVVSLDDRVLAVIEMPGDPDWLVAGFGSVWVKRDDGNVVRIDPASHELLATIDAALTSRDLCQGIGADETSIWTCSGKDIVRIDPETNAAIEAVAVGKIFVQGRLVHEAGSIWILTGENADQLVAVDSATRGLGSPIELGATCWDLAAGAGSVWAACAPANLVLRIDPATGTVTDRIEVEEPMQLSVGETATWVATAGGVVRIDLRDLTLTTIAMDPSPADEGGIFAGGGSVWVRTADPFLTRIDPSTSTLIEVITTDEHGPGDVLELDGTLWVSDYVEGAIVHLGASP